MAPLPSPVRPVVFIALLLAGCQVREPDVSVDTEANDDEGDEGDDEDNDGASSNVTIATVGDDDDEGDDGEGDDDSIEPGSECDLDALEAAVIAFCEVQAAGKHTPGSGETGAPCSSGDSCNGICVDDYPYDGSGYCGDTCQTNAGCPFGYECSALSGGTLACTEAFCLVPLSAAECVSDYIEKAEGACDFDCGAELSDWLACVTEAAPICNESDATDCGIEQGLLDACCENGNLC